MKKKIIASLACALALGTVACGKADAKKDESAEKEEKKQKGIDEGDTVVARWSGSSFYEGEVEDKGKKMKIKWADGSKPSEVEKGLVFPLPDEDEPHEVDDGDFVLAKRSGGTKWWGAKVLDAGDSVKVKYVNDASEEKVEAHEVIPAPDEVVDDMKKALANAKIVSGARDAGEPFKPAGWIPKPGAEVVAVWAVSTWYQGKVKSVSGGKPTVQWNDNSKPSEVKADQVVPVPTASSPKAKEGDYVLVAPSSSSLSTWKYGQVTGVSGAKADVKVQDGTTRSVGNTEYVLIQ